MLIEKMFNNLGIFLLFTTKLLYNVNSYGGWICIIIYWEVLQT